MSSLDVGPVEPLARAAGAPALYSVLGAVFHLEILKPDDEPRLQDAVEIVRDWFGDRLRWTNKSCDEWISRFRLTDLEYISCYVRDLAEPQVADPDAQLFAANLAKVGRMDYELACNGAEQDGDASPFLLRFCAEIPEVGRGPLYQPYAVLTVTVPDTWPIEDFRTRVTAIAAALRLRWGAAGLTYASWDVQEFQVSHAKVYAHARRHPGYDVGYFEADMESWHDEIRTVNWLTFVGPALVAKLEAAQRRLESSSLVTVRSVGSSLCLQAGSAPEAGDVNRLHVPPAYVEADSLVRPVRAADGRPYVFLGRWNESTVTDWLRRFERRFS